MKTLLKLALVGVILNALFQGAQATWRHFGLTDDARQVVLFGSELPTSNVHDQILAKAAERGLTVQPEDLQVERAGQRTTVEGHYINEVEFFPGYRYKVPVSFTIAETVVKPPTASDILGQP